ncbi:MAG: ribosomal RNA small subunit methyltransferase A [Planctomycetota bacterium]|nr:MAG: ribosomal RNA small subunit methyltransferase A [Planctomycetota bacterium]
MTKPMSLREQLRLALTAAGLAPNHRLGQNFMVDGGALDTLIRHAEIGPGSRVVEIGPGTGFLTQRLLGQGATVCAVELDSGLHAYLGKHFLAQREAEHLQLVHGDALAGKTALHPAIVSFAKQGPWKLVSNLPYDISIPALLNALTMADGASKAVVTVQWEAAQRLISPAGSNSWGATAAVAQAAGRGEVVAKLPPRCFYPPPRVDSAVLMWQRQPAMDRLEGFAGWCRHLFSYRRKRLSRALRDCGWPRDSATTLVSALGLAEDLRVEQLTVAQLAQVYGAYNPTATGDTADTVHEKGL